MLAKKSQNEINVDLNYYNYLKNRSEYKDYFVEIKPKLGVIKKDNWEFIVKSK